ncbi:MAG: hypothetical protein ACREBS_10765 [Nitrososphaerales archaeon]
MGRIDVILPDDREEKLRMEVGKRIGARRGALTDAINEAIQNWIDQEATRRIEKEKEGRQKK